MAQRVFSKVNLSPDDAKALTDRAAQALVQGGDKPAKMLAELSAPALLNPFSFDLQLAYLHCLNAAGDREGVVSHCERLVQLGPEIKGTWDTYISMLDNMGKPRSDIVHVELRAQKEIPGYISPTSEPELPPYHNTP